MLQPANSEISSAPTTTASSVVGATRLERLQEVTAALSVSLTPEQVAEVVVAQGVTALGARAGSLVLVTDAGQALQMLRALGYPDAALEPYHYFPLNTNLPVADAARTGAPVFLTSWEDWQQHYPEVAERAVLANKAVLQDAAWAAVPLRTHGQVIGAIGLSFAEPHLFDSAERDFMEALAGQCAQALERAQFYADAQRQRADAEAARARFAFLAEASAALATSLDYETTLGTLVRLAVPRLSDWAAVDMLTPRGQIARLAVAHTDPAKVQWAHEIQRRYPPSLEESTGLGRVLRTGEREYYPRITDALLTATIDDPDRLALAREIGFASYLCIALKARGRILGALTFVTTHESERFLSADDVALAEEMARNASVMVDNARLFRAAQESEERLAGIIGSAMDAIITTDEDRRILVFNAAAERMFRCPAKDALGSLIDRFLPDAPITPADSGLPGDAVIATPEVRTARRADGEEFAMEVTVSEVTTGGQKLHTAILRDITERLRAEAQVRESERRFRDMADTAPVLIWMSDTDGRFDWFNRPWREFTGRSMEQEIGAGWLENVHPDDLAQSLQIYQQACAAQAPFEREYRLRRHDGVYRYLLDIGRPRFLEDGTFVGYIGSSVDITERREATQLLLEQETRQRRFLRDVLSSVTEGRLRLCETPADLPEPLAPASEWIKLTAESMRPLRLAAHAAALTQGISEDRAQDLLTAVGEAGMNAVRHGGGGRSRIYAENGALQIWIEDQGKGIDLQSLPRALERGYTTGGGFGHGFYLMLHSVDRVYLLTGPKGTTVVLEQGSEAPQPSWLQSPNIATADW